MDITQLISIAGIGGIIGSLATVFFQSWLSNLSYKRNRKFKEKKEAYIGLLEAYHKAAVTRSNASAKEFAYWQMRCDLVASNAVIQIIQELIDTNDDRELRDIAHDMLKKALRDDLGIE